MAAAALDEEDYEDFLFLDCLFDIDKEISTYGNGVSLGKTLKLWGIDVTSRFRQKLRMDLSIDDCEALIFRYYEDFNGIVEDNDLHGLIGDDNEADTG
ncbi:uncharacterized protein IUM83_01048 [Phytophthora cinnamomi]|uniref:uncharacterized protein n=1 Tax=Phytophthora cinnamomi TaxID=4785 RepID=UPI0035596F3B|nr:hypothetical protein IUM83_01048 [Phytophthora cinnamomi]